MSIANYPFLCDTAIDASARFLRLSYYMVRDDVYHMNLVYIFLCRVLSLLLLLLLLLPLFSPPFISYFIVNKNSVSSIIIFSHLSQRFRLLSHLSTLSLYLSHLLLRISMNYYSNTTTDCFEIGYFIYLSISR